MHASPRFIISWQACRHATQNKHVATQKCVASRGKQPCTKHRLHTQPHTRSLTFLTYRLGGELHEQRGALRK